MVLLPQFLLPDTSGTAGTVRTPGQGKTTITLRLAPTAATAFCFAKSM